MLDIQPEEVMAFGDNGTDMPMLKEAGISVAVGNSNARIKDSVDYVCLSNDEQGVSKFLKEYFQ